MHSAGAEEFGGSIRMVPKQAGGCTMIGHIWLFLSEYARIPILYRTT
jgi:hypothetical protein